MTRKRKPPSARNRKSHREPLKHVTPSGLEVDLTDGEFVDDDFALTRVREWVESWPGKYVAGVNVYPAKEFSKADAEVGCGKNGWIEIMLHARGKFFLLSLDPAEGVSEYRLHRHLDAALAKALA